MLQLFILYTGLEHAINTATSRLSLSPRLFSVTK
jgi:hypothetical protein